VERNHLYKRDLDWLPRSYKIVRWTTTGAVWTAAAAAAGTLGAVLHSGGAGSVAYSVVIGGLLVGDSAARALLRNRLSKLAHGQVELSRLKQEADGELVHVRGRVRARTDLPGVLDDGTRCVYRRVQFAIHPLNQAQRSVHEAAVDFALVDETGESIIVEVEGSRLVASEPKLARVEQPAAVERLLSLPLPKEFDRWRAKRAERIAKGKQPARALAGEFLLRDGDAIEVVGYKNRRVDVTVDSRLERDTPMRATLRAGRELPLILSPAR
jgi:hypothetical protein